MGLLWLACVWCVTAIVSYDGYRVLRVAAPQDGLQRLASRDVELGLDIWGSPHAGALDVMVAPTKLTAVLQALRGMSNTTVATHIDNVQRLIDAESAEQATLRQSSAMAPATERCGADKYCTYEEADEWTTALAGTYSEIVKRIDPSTTTHQGRKVIALEIAKPGATAAHTVYVDALIHSREWVTGGAINYFIRWAVEGLANGDPIALALFDKARFIVVPIVNPDGYVYNVASDRMWRKTRTPNPTRPQCIGTDANRNLPMGWGGGGSSNDPCSDAYRGSAAYSEPAVKAVFNDLLGPYMDRREVKIGLCMHAYGLMWMTPYGYTGTKPSNYGDQIKMGELAVNAIRARLGQTYRLGTVYDVVYQASGGTTDTLFGRTAGGSENIKIPYAFGAELDTTFTTPVNRIVPTGEAVRDALIAMVNGL